ncbi:hypothetical protein K3495_g4148 [Podosphaera aphanis]|nr:hypothetical protein K3495_g4148 [Podosphaera aphanis]
MTSNTGLYGIRRPKNDLKQISSSANLAFTSTISSLISTASSGVTSSGRPRPSKSKSDIFTSHNKGIKRRSLRDIDDDSNQQSQTHRKVKRDDLEAVDDARLHRSKRKMQMKAKIYARLKRGEIEENEEALVDFDHKWAEQQEADSDSDQDSDIEDSNEKHEMVEYEDEFGRVRQVTKTELERLERKKKTALLGAEELGKMSARPMMPSKIIYGDTVQTLAFNPDKPVATKMEELAAKRDRSLTPPPLTHYEADKEIRTKGVGFYSFSKDEGLRESEMKALEQERLETENIRKEREEKKNARLREIKERRRAVQEKRAKKQADSFLERLTG